LQQLRKKTSSKNQSKLTRALNQIASSTSTYNLAPTGAVGSLHSPQRESFDTSALYGSYQTDSSTSNRASDGGLGLIPTDRILKMLQVHAESVTRCVELADSQELALRVGNLFEILIDFISTKYLDIALDTTYEEIDTRAEPELRSFAVVKAVKDIIHLLQGHFEASIVSKL
jgi:hypothetical protein